MMLFGANFLYFYLQNSFETIEIKMGSAANIFPSRAVSEMAGCSREEEKYNEPKRLEEVRILSVFFGKSKKLSDYRLSPSFTSRRPTETLYWIE